MLHDDMSQQSPRRRLLGTPPLDLMGLRVRPERIRRALGLFVRGAVSLVSKTPPRLAVLIREPAFAWGWKATHTGSVSETNIEQMRQLLTSVVLILKSARRFRNLVPVLVREGKFSTDSAPARVRTRGKVSFCDKCRLFQIEDFLKISDCRLIGRTGGLTSRSTGAS